MSRVVTVEGFPAPLLASGPRAPNRPDDHTVHTAERAILDRYAHRRGCAAAAFDLGWRTALTLDRAARGEITHG